MKTKVRNDLAFSLAIAGAKALPLAPDAVSRKGLTPPPHCHASSYAQPRGLSSAFYTTTRPCAASAANSARAGAFYFSNHPEGCDPAAVSAQVCGHILR